MITVACVWTRGPKNYEVRDVLRLRNALKIWIPPDVPYRFVCYTDRPGELHKHEVATVDISSTKLQTWWAKMCLFNPKWRHPNERLIYYDLDTVVVGSQIPLLDWRGGFGICESFTRELHKHHWPCAYGSCVMSMPPDWGAGVWDAFQKDQEQIIKDCRQYGDQLAIERLYPGAAFLQKELPSGFFMGYRNLVKYPKNPPAGTALVIYAGKRSPKNYGPPWVRDMWNSY